ncbi:Tripeptidyl-peptidase sed2 [Apiospora rasikravindrae]|uniref:tripeptidyl-peptidase II n=1 Tax=Apiospora rasikravindrae TaxID=990691 RepID=A0ABR1TW63_9PEZI
MLAPTLASVFLAAGLVAGLPQPAADLVEHEKAARVPESWHLVRSATADDFLTLRIAVKEHRKVNENHILARSDPNSPLYGKYLGARELNALLADSTHAGARKASWEKVQRWIHQQNIPITRESARGFEIKVRASEAESLFGTKFSYYTRDGDDEPVARTEAYSLPLGVRDDIDFVYPTVHFFDSSRSRVAQSSKLDRRQHFPTGPFDCSKYNCPVNLTAKYNIDYVPETASASKLAIGGFLEQYADHEDWKNFIDKFGLANFGIGNASNQASFNVVNVNGGENKDSVNDAQIEAQLDLDFSTAFTGPLNVTYHLVGGRPPAQSQPGNVPIPIENNAQEPYLEYLDFLLAQEDVPQVVSISYTDDEQAVCDRFSYLALRGVSVLVASGDSGAQGTRFSDCKGPDGEYRFIPTFPASCPWVTTVGATTAWGGAAAFSAGGFSNYYPQPEWQRDAVEKYLASGDTGMPENPWFAWNASGRAYPDLSLLGTDYLVMNRGSPSPTKGTSASTPVVAAMITLLNDIRLKKGMPALGFLNPLLYASNVAEGAFTDITENSINGCSNRDHQQPGFKATKGWDAASGLGEPDFAKLRKLLA